VWLIFLILGAFLYAMYGLLLAFTFLVVMLVRVITAIIHVLTTPRTEESEPT
jgi:hypothetical protein